MSIQSNSSVNYCNLGRAIAGLLIATTVTVVVLAILANLNKADFLLQPSFNFTKRTWLICAGVSVGVTALALIIIMRSRAKNGSGDRVGAPANPRVITYSNISIVSSTDRTKNFLEDD